MRYIACHNDECVNKGAPYHINEPIRFRHRDDPDGFDFVVDAVEEEPETLYACPLCDEPMSDIPDPTLPKEDDSGA